MLIGKREWNRKHGECNLEYLLTIRSKMKRSLYLFTSAHWPIFWPLFSQIKRKRYVGITLD